MRIREMKRRLRVVGLKVNSHSTECPDCFNWMFWFQRPVVHTTRWARSNFAYVELKSTFERWEHGRHHDSSGLWCLVCHSELDELLAEEEIKFQPLEVVKAQVEAIELRKEAMLREHAARWLQINFELEAKKAQLKRLNGVLPEGGYRGLPRTT